MNDSGILFVGWSAVDVISLCDGYPPPEDTKQRCLDQWLASGGNACNSSVVCAQLGAPTELLTSLPDRKDPLNEVMLNELQKYGVDYSHCVHHANTLCRKSVIIINKKNGSRTIIYSTKASNCPQLSFADFEKVNWANYKWIHFEGCYNADNIKQMLHVIAQHNSRITDASQKIGTSFELEIPYPGVEELLSCQCDLIFVSKDFAQPFGANSMEEAVRIFSAKSKSGASCVCTGGEYGAAICIQSSDGPVVTTVPAWPQPEIIDTIGAGDTFIGSMLFALTRGASLTKSVEFGCHVAGGKCSQIGFANLDRFRTVWNNYYVSSL